MSNLFKLSFVLLFTSIALAQAPTEKQDQYVRFKTKIINGGFENGTSQWSASGGVFAASTTLSDSRSGLRGGIFDASAASQTLTSAANTVSAGNAVVSCWFKTAATDYTFSAYDGTNLLVTQTIPASTVFQKIALNYALSSAGQLRARITSASNASVLQVDDCFAGEADNVGNGNFATEYTSYTPAINITTNVTSSGKWRRVGDSADLELGIDFSGAPTAFSTMEIDLPSGFLFDTSKLLSSSSTKEHLCFGAWFDPAGGTTRYFAEGSYVDTNTIRVRYMNNTGALVYMNADISNSSPFTVVSGAYLRLTCNGLPIQGWNSQSVFDPNLLPWYVDANISGSNPDLGTADQTSYVGIENGSLTLTSNAGGLTTQIPCSSTNSPTGTTCAAGNESVGVSFVLPVAGKVKACASFAQDITTGASGLVKTTYQIVETPINAQTITQEGKSRIQGGLGTANGNETYPYRVCGDFTFSSAGQKVLRLFYEQDTTATVSSNLVLADGSTTNGQRDIHWEVWPMDQSIPMPLLVGGVSTGSTIRSEKIDSANVIGTAGTMSSQSSSWVTVSRTSAGIYPITFASGYYSGEPRCTVSLADSSNGLIRFFGLPSNTGGSIVITNTLDTLNVDRNYTFQCMGPK